MFESNESVLEDLLNRIGETLQLTQTKHDLAVQHYAAVGDLLAKDPQLAPFNPRIHPHGSFAIGTTLRPLAREEYDLDLVVEIDHGNYTSHQLYDAVGQALRANARYAGMISPKKRCWRLTYEHDFHMDILPARPDVRREAPPKAVQVPDRELRDWKESNPRGYAEWYEGKARLPALDKRFAEASVEPAPPQQAYLEKPPLKRATQLLKRWRDVRWANDLDNAPISIVLTTLAAEGYGQGRSAAQAMDQILAGIISRLPTQGRLRVLNPMNRLEDFSERWDSNPAAYVSFADSVRALAAEWAVLRKLGGDQLYARLGRLFGEDVTNRVIKEHATYVRDLSSRGGLGVSAQGRLVSVATPTAVAAVRPNTFYGGKRGG